MLRSLASRFRRPASPEPADPGPDLDLAWPDEPRWEDGDGPEPVVVTATGDPLADRPDSHAPQAPLTSYPLS